MLASDAEVFLRREWLETNGIGGFASATATGSNTRRYHGLLTAATKPPLGRMVLLSRFEEALLIDGNRRVEFSTNRYPGTLHPHGYQYQTGFRLDPWPVFEYEVEGTAFEKHVFLVHGENTVVVQYAFSHLTTQCRLELRPLLACRDYHSLMHANNAARADYRLTQDAVVLQPYNEAPPLHLSHGGAAQVERTADWYYRFRYDREQERGLDFEEDLFNPCRLTIDVAANEVITIVASTQPRSPADARVFREAEKQRRHAVTNRIPDADPFTKRLVAAADSFVVARGEGKTVIAGYHWFSDWGRDTMIALPGLTLATGRCEDARSLLREFVQHLDCGMLPNRFPDIGEQPEYNTVDATLWLFEAVRQFVAATGEREWAVDEMYPALRSVIEWHIAGTRYAIKADVDGLLHAGEPGMQLTWMDVKIGDWVVTPRHGKPVEIQALWYNALRITEELADAAGDLTTHHTARDLADRARGSFISQFWNDQSNCLYDVIDAPHRDASIRPNQIFAVSLHHSMLPPDRQRLVVQTVERELLTPLGLRTLSPGDPAYRPRYQGGVTSRDSAYHQGTVWPWLMGAFITAYLKVNDRNGAAVQRAGEWLRGFEAALQEYGLGQLPEVADGDATHRPGGCIAQAWSVAEILRAARETSR